MDATFLADLLMTSITGLKDILEQNLPYFTRTFHSLSTKEVRLIQVKPSQFFAR